MKVIDLLNKIANGEKVPKKIKYKEYLYKFDDKCNNYIRFCDNNCSLNWDYIAISGLNDEVEIIIGEDKKDDFTGWKMYQDGREVCSIGCSQEEDKKIEKIKMQGFSLFDVADKVNEIIDEINEMKEGK